MPTRTVPGDDLRGGEVELHGLAAVDVLPLVAGEAGRGGGGADDVRAGVPGRPSARPTGACT